MSGHRIQLLLATSGTTGEPRLMALSGNNLRAAAEAANRVLGLGSADCWLATLPLHHIGGLMTVLRPWLAGAGVALIHPFDPRAVLARLEAGGISHLSLVPTQLLRLLQADPAFRPPADLRVVLVGGAPLETALAERALAAGWPLCPTYGLTEAASQVATCLPPPRRWQAGLAGRVLPHLEVAITEEGRIRLRGASVAAWRLGETGARSLTDQSGWYTTGDLGRWDGQGRLHILGRADDLILTGGEKIHPAAVEAELLRCPGVEEAVVAGVEDEVWGMRVVAGYRGAWPESRVAAWAESHLAGAHRPKRFLRLEEIPRNALGKPLRRVLRQRFL
jgi:O-succinylbenzoic acid--CoA ligase